MKTLVLNGILEIKENHYDVHQVPEIYINNYKLEQTLEEEFGMELFNKYDSICFASDSKRVRITIEELE